MAAWLGIVRDYCVNLDQERHNRYLGVRVLAAPVWDAAPSGSLVPLRPAALCHPCAAGAGHSPRRDLAERTALRWAAAGTRRGTRRRSGRSVAHCLLSLSLVRCAETRI